MRRLTGFGALVHALAILALMAAGSQFAHAHELSGHFATGHAAHIEIGSQGNDLPDPGAKSEVHCGAHILPLVADIVLVPSVAAPLYTSRSPHPEWKGGPDFEPPPPRA